MSNIGKNMGKCLFIAGVLAVAFSFNLPAVANSVEAASMQGGGRDECGYGASQCTGDPNLCQGGGFNYCGSGTKESDSCGDLDHCQPECWGSNRTDANCWYF